MTMVVVLILNSWCDLVTLMLNQNRIQYIPSSTTVEEGIYNTGKLNVFVWNETIGICSNIFYSIPFLHWPYLCQPDKRSYNEC